MAVDLSLLRATKTPKPPRIVVYGGEGVGKSTFFASAPNPVFIQTEDGLDNLEVVKLPQEGPAKNLGEVKEFIAELYRQDHDFKTVVVDSADWLEKLVREQVCEDNKWDSIESPGYGKGYTVAAEVFGEIVKGLQALREKRGMIVCLTAHSEIKSYADPMNGSYDRHVVKLHRHTSGILKEWADVIGLATVQTFVESEEKGFGKVSKRAISRGGRKLHLSSNAAFEAKNRYGIAQDIDLDFHSLIGLIAESQKKEKDNG